MMKKFFQLMLVVTVVTLLASLTACSSGSSGYRSHVSYGAGYRGYYGHRPWGYYPGYGGGRPIDPDWEVDAGRPEAVPLPMPEPGYPDMGMPDMGGMDMDMGGFDF